jgi:DNA-binding GntR family transcriptional regulator
MLLAFASGVNAFLRAKGSCALLEGFETLPSLSLVTQVKDRILRAITNGDLLPGQRIVEGEVAQRLGTSRGPVREAARLLEQRGLLVSLPRRGFFVRQFEAKEIEDLYEVREWIEVAAARSATVHASAAEIRSLRLRHGEIVTAAQKKAQPELIDAIIDFHRTICALAGNARLMRLFDEIAVEVNQILSVLGVAVDERGLPVEVQASLLEALETRNAALAEHEMSRYVRQAKAEVLEHYRRRQAAHEAPQAAASRASRQPRHRSQAKRAPSKART